MICAILTSVSSFGIDVIPKPVKVTEMNGSFSITPQTRIIHAVPAARPLAEYLCDYLPCRTVQPPSLIPRQKGNIVLNIDPLSDMPGEGYRLSVYDDRIEITGKDYGGLFNGIQTLLQLLPEQVYGKNAAGSTLTVDNVIINDWPQFPYRGMHLDVARTFVSKDDVLRFIDNMSYHKLNKFHFHLTDDEEWRIEIKSHPELACTGGFRGGDSPVRAVYGEWDRKYGGYYTQSEIREIIDYAAVRNIEVIPEIDLPGHSRTIALLHPEILCDYRPDLSASAGYDMRNVWCVSRQENYALLEDILREVAMLFPSQYIHIGGDEVFGGQWLKCPSCRSEMQRNGLTEPAQLQNMFMVRLAEILARNGKKAAVWNEAAEGGALPEDTRVHCWEDMASVRKAASKGYATIIMPGKYFYFDMRQSADEPGHTWAAIFDTGKCYSFDFAQTGLSPEQTDCIAGVEGAFWTELYLSNGHGFMDYQIFPRLCALSEIAWTPQAQRSWKHFSSRLDAHTKRLDAMGIGYRTEPEKSEKAAPAYPSVTLTSSMPQSDRNPYSNAERYAGQARTKRTCTEGDWFLFTFGEALTCGRIEIVTGYSHLPRCLITAGYVETSSDGQNFTHAAALNSGRACIDVSQPVKAVRIVAECHGNGEDNVIIQPLKILK